MPLYLSDLASERKTLTIEHGVHTVKIGYNPNDMSATTIRKFNAIKRRIDADEAEEDDLDWLFETAELMIAQWDMYMDKAAEERGEMWPITKANLSLLPVALVAKMVEAIFGDLNPSDDPKSSGANSDGISESPRSTRLQVKKR